MTHPEKSKHKPIPISLVKATEHTTPVPDCMIPGWGIPAVEDERGNFVLESWTAKDNVFIVVF